MRSVFDAQLEEVNIELIKMGSLCEEALKCSAKVLFDADTDSLIKTEELEREIDIKERSIEDLCVKILLHQQPVAKDLRVVSSAMKMIADMERIGDQAKDIAELGEIICKKDIVSEVHIRKMYELAAAMLRDSIDAFVTKNIELAESIEHKDDEVDKCFDNVKGELIELLKKENSDNVTCLDILMVAKYLERIGDHAVNISEWVVYAIEGKKMNNYCTEN